MFPTFHKLSIDTRTSQRVLTDNSEKQSDKGIQKHKRDKESLPPGWWMYQNNSGDMQFTDGNIHTYTVRDAWKRYEKQKRMRGDLSPDASDKLDLCERTEDYGSISKELHRKRIVDDMVTYACETGHVPSLVYLGAPDGSDSQFFQRQMSLHDKLTNARFVAVNLADIQRIDDTDKVEFVKDTIENYMETVGDNVFSHAWLDTTSLEIDNKLLWNTVRSTIAKIYLVVSLRGNSGYRLREDSAMIVKTQCDFFGLVIKHEEAYAGINPQGGQSNKINMMFFGCNITGPRQKQPVYDQHYNLIGAMIDIPVDMTQSLLPKITHDMNIFTHKNAYVGLIKGYNHMFNMWSVQFFDSHGNLLPDVFQTVPSARHTTSIFNRGYFK